MADMGDGGSGAASGASAGASIGSAILPGWGTAIGAGVGAVGGFFAGAFGGGGEESGALKLSPEQEMQMLDYYQGAIDTNRGYLDQNFRMQDIYNQRMNMVVEYTQGTLPDETMMRGLTNTAMQIASSFGMNAMAAYELGFLDEYSGKISGLLEQREEGMANANQEDLDYIKTVQAADYTDPRVEGALTEQRRQLEQQLARDGVSPAQRQIALRQFENEATNLRFSTRQQAINDAVQTASTKIAARAQSLQGSSGALGAASNVYLAGRQNLFNEAMQGYSSALNGLTYGQSTIAAMAGLAGTQAAMNQQFVGIGMQISQREAQMYAEQGKYDLTKTGRQALEAGVVGPGSIYEQSGMSRNEMGSYKDWIREQENEASKYGSPKVNYGGYQSYKKGTTGGFVVGPGGVRADPYSPGARPQTPTSGKPGVPRFWPTGPTMPAKYGNTTSTRRKQNERI
jgi:hypothetical protein